MVSKEKIVEFLDSYLDVKSIPDMSANGLQIDGKKDVKTIAFAVDACKEVFEKAKDCDMIIVHHGLFWDKIGPIRKQLYSRIKVLMDNNISLYAAHAPLDKSETVGNNAELLKMFGLEPKNEFGFDHDVSWGYYDAFKKPIPIGEAMTIIRKLNKDFQYFLYGKKMIRTIACVSGGASFAVAEAIEKGVDLLIIGEMKHSAFHDIKEGKINLIAAGHYATETLGVKALAEVLEKKFNVKTKFIDVPTGL